MSKYRPVFVSLDSSSMTVPFNGLTMREIYSRFVKTGQRPVENSNTVSTTEDDPYYPDQDIYERVQVLSSTSVEESPVDTSSAEPESTE